MAASQSPALDDYAAEHGYVLTNALDVYSEHMREQATKCQATYDAIKDDPDKFAEQDRSFVTTNGLRQMAVMFSESADRADKARAAWDRLVGDEDDPKPA